MQTSIRLETIALAAITAITLNTATIAATIRIDFPQLLGEYQLEFNSSAFSPTEQRFDLVEIFHKVDRAQIFLSWTQIPGTVRGDGVIRPATEAEISPFLHPINTLHYEHGTTFINHHDGLGNYSTYSTYLLPFIPPPGTNVSPPTGFGIGLYIAPDFENVQLPFLPREGGLPWQFLGYGLTIEQAPTIAVTEAYMVLEGHGIPEPAAATTMILGSTLALLVLRFRSYRIR